jgi:di/tricarboxylate transporter
VQLRIYVPVALACAFWLLPLTAAVWLGQKYGFYEEGLESADSVPLLGIPIFMIALTVALGWLAKRQRLTGLALSMASAAALLGPLLVSDLGARRLTDEQPLSITRPHDFPVGFRVSALRSALSHRRIFASATANGSSQFLRERG